MEKDDRGPYINTLVLEAFLSAFRFPPGVFLAAVIGGIVAYPLMLLFDLSIGAEDEEALIVALFLGGIFLALSPLIVSVLTLTVLPGGYGLTRRELGAREPSVREREELLGVLQELTETAPRGTIEPSKWLVIDALDPNALVVGTTIYVHRGLFRTPYLLPVLAHELGHLNHDDGRLVLALRRLVPPPLSYLTFEGGGCLPLILKLCSGGLGLTLMMPAWNSYWQKREFLADRFAFECGQAAGLIDFLEVHQFFDAAVPFHTFRSTHPYTEERIDRLQDALEEEGDAPMEPHARALDQENEATTSDLKKGYTDAESVLDLVFLDEDHAGSGDPERIATEKAWIRANGLRIVDLAHSGNIVSGPGAILIHWVFKAEYILGTNKFHLVFDVDEQYDDHNFEYITAYYHSQFLGQPFFQTGFNLDPAISDKWRKVVETHDSDQSVVVLIYGVHPELERLDANHYLVGMPGGAPLLKGSDPTLGSLPANERGGGSLRPST